MSKNSRSYGTSYRRIPSPKGAILDEGQAPAQSAAKAA